MNKLKRFHFRCTWKNGDPLVICSYGFDKRDAYIKILQAVKNKLFEHRKGDYFRVSYYTNEEHYNELIKAGCSSTESAWLSVYGHTGYILCNGKVTIN